MRPSSPSLYSEALAFDFSRSSSVACFGPGWAADFSWCENQDSLPQLSDSGADWPEDKFAVASRRSAPRGGTDPATGAFKALLSAPHPSAHLPGRAARVFGEHHKRDGLLPPLELFSPT